MCPTQNNSSGSLKYPDIDKDKTEVLQKQVKLLAKNVSKVFKFSFKFKRHGPEFQKIDEIEREEDRLGNVRRKGYLDFEQIGFSEPALYEYRATVKLSIKQALELLQDYGVNLEYNVYRTYKVKDKEGREKVVPFPRKPTKEEPGTPRGGISTRLNTPKREEIYSYPHIRPHTTQVLVSHEFDIAEGCFPGWHANREDYLTIRKGLWHEIMETALIAIAIEALYCPKDLYYNLSDNPENNFANNAVMRVQRAMEAIREDRRLFLYWDGDPPFDAFESAAFCREEDAEYATGKANAMEEFDIWAAAYEKWKEAEKAWEVAIRAWQAVPHHPDRDKKIAEARERLAEAKIRKGIAQSEAQRGATKPAPSWNVAGSGGEKITIHYSDWPNGFRAKILDYKERKVTEVSGTPGSKKGKVEWGKDADPGTYYVEVNVSGERSEKVIITKKLEWSACVKFGTNGPYISITPKSGTKWPKGKGFGFSIHNSSGSKLGFVNVPDSNRTAEVTWGRESNQRFGDWGKHIIWAYAHDLGLQEMFKDKNFFPNWKTEVEIPVPSFKVNGVSATPILPATGPLIPPDLRQRLTIEYDNWPGKFKGIIRKRSSTQELVRLEGSSCTKGTLTKEVNLATGVYWIATRPYDNPPTPIAIELTVYKEK